MKVPFFTPWITQDDKKNVLQALNQRWLTNGPYLRKFEERVRKFIGSSYSVGVGSATHALHLAMRAIDVGSGDEVIVPTFTFAATANVVKYCGAKPVLTDVDNNTFNISPSEIKKNVNKKTKAIIVVHYGGQACDMNQINSIAKKNGLYIIEDCAHALGSKYKNKHCGNIGELGCFSFYPTKIITTGEGGMITCNNHSIYNKVSSLRSQGMNKLPHQREKKAEWKYDIIDLGYNYRLDELRSSLGFSQMKRVNQINKMRIKIAHVYDKKLRDIEGITIPYQKSERNHIYHLYTIKIGQNYPLDRNELFKKLSRKGIGASVQFYPLHLMSYYKKEYRIKKHRFPVSNKLKDEVLSLPIFPTMNQNQVNKVISILK